MRWADETDDEVIDRLWRARFGQPLPVMGSAAFAWKILSDWTSPLGSGPSSQADDVAPGGGVRPRADLTASSQI